MINSVLQPLVVWCIYTLLKVTFIFVLCCIFMAAAFLSYWLFYWAFVPQNMHSFPVYLQYRQAEVKLSFAGVRQPGPEACSNVSFTGPQWSAIAVPSGPTTVGRTLLDQVSVDVDIAASFMIPLAPENAAVGPIMVDCEVFSNMTMVAQSSRPFVLPYRSSMTQLAQSVLWIVPAALGWTKEEREVMVPLIEGLAVNFDAPLSSARLCVSPAIPVHSGSLVLQTQAVGFRGLIQRHPALLGAGDLY
jgi:hypothetical protein